MKVFDKLWFDLLRMRPTGVKNADELLTNESEFRFSPSSSLAGSVSKKDGIGCSIKWGSLKRENACSKSAEKADILFSRDNKSACFLARSC